MPGRIASSKSRMIASPIAPLIFSSSISCGVLMSRAAIVIPLESTSGTRSRSARKPNVSSRSRPSGPSPAPSSRSSDIRSAAQARVTSGARSGMNCQVTAGRTSFRCRRDTSSDVWHSNSTGSPSAGTRQWRANVSAAHTSITLVPVA